MSIAMIRHFWNNNREQVLQSSYMNCHVRGLHSVMLLNEPGKRVRLFVTDIEHQLWKNYPYSGKRMSVGYHGHHCDITIEVVKGAVGNVELGLTPGSLVLQEFMYRSKLLNKAPSFEPTDQLYSFVANNRILRPGDHHSMAATDYHSVAIEAGHIASWVVYEGKDDPNYVSNMFTNWDMKDFSFDGLYKPMDESQARWCLRMAGVL